MVTVIDTTDAEWWQGKCLGKVGYFPSKYVTKLFPGERPLQVIHTVQVNDGEFVIKLLRDQVGHLPKNESSRLIMCTDCHTSVRGDQRHDNGTVDPTRHQRQDCGMSSQVFARYQNIKSLVFDALTMDTIPKLKQSQREKDSCPCSCLNHRLTQR